LPIVKIKKKSISQILTESVIFGLCVP